MQTQHKNGDPKRNLNSVTGNKNFCFNGLAFVFNNCYLSVIYWWDERKSIGKDPLQIRAAPYISD